MDAFSTPNPYPFLAGGGQAGDLIRQVDWSTSSLNTPENWPYSLRVSVSNLLLASQPMLVLWGEEHICFYNDAVIPTLKPQTHPAIGKPARDVWGEGLDFIGPLLAGVLKTGEPVMVQDAPITVYRNGQTQAVFWTASCSLIRDDEGKNGGVFVNCLETTQAVHARQALGRSQQLFDNLFTSAPVAIALFVGPRFVIEQANDLVLAYWGRSRQQVMHKPLFEALPEAAGQGFEELLTKVYTTGERFIAKELTVTLERNGQVAPTYIDFVYEPVRQPDGTITGVLVVCTEITEQVLARKRVEASEQLLRAMVLNAPIGISVLNATDLVIEIVNPSFIELAGKPYEELVGQNYWVPFAEAAPYYEEALTRVARQGESFSVNEVELMLIRHGQQEIIYVTLVYMPLNDATGSVQKVVVWLLENTHQVTQRRKVEQLVQQRTEELDAANKELALLNQTLAASNEEYAAMNEELTASSEEIDKVNRGLEESNRHLSRSNQNLEQFAYIASHDLQEPLRKIQQFGDLLKQRYGSAAGDEVAYLDRMQLAASRMSLLIRDLLAFSRISTGQAPTVLVNLNQVVDQALDTLSVPIEETGAHIQVDTLPTIQGDGSQLLQLFQNLISNALKFSRQDQAGQPAIPRITIRANELPVADLPASVKPPRPALVYYQIEVTDNGIGFEEKYAERIFQVFQRLHGRTEFAGTGVGLAICEKVVTNHGGVIRTTSQPGQGATFSVYFPG